MTQLRFQETYIEAYETDGWKKRSHEKLKPSAELEKYRRKLRYGKQMVLEDLREFQARFELHQPLPRDASEMNDEDILCAKCRLSTTAPDNDILICESIGCKRVYHQQCLEPVLLTKDMPPEDVDWYCQLCLGLFEALKLINLTCDTACMTVEELFPDLDKEVAEPAPSDSEDDLGTASKAHTSGDDSDHEADEAGRCNFESAAPESSDLLPQGDDDRLTLDGANIVDGKRRRTTVDYRALIAELPPSDEDEDNDGKEEYAPPEDSPSDHSDASSSSSEDEEDPATLIVEGKRQRTRVDYLALNGQLFPNDAGEEEEDGEYAPAPAAPGSSDGDDDDDDDMDADDTTGVTEKRKPGRPRKAVDPTAPPRKRGRPPLKRLLPDGTEAPPRKRGRPPKVVDPNAPPRKRGRPPTKHLKAAAALLTAQTVEQQHSTPSTAAAPTIEMATAERNGDTTTQEDTKSLVDHSDDPVMLSKRRRTPVDYVALSGGVDH
ncbi:hypothetical protein ACHHYP_08256 [Achlya hypogyna]|uniref:PHD-type domain-containing protein n=1 Tax=Achlya hypogyna TaxID=1202772 RepID=A0A1V9ZL71_ACHHY|nr:hypothetical protein ACHHYP_08256 [Achlya hypogyna]